MHQTREKNLWLPKWSKFERYEETAEQELKLLASLVNPQVDIDTLSPSERALIVLQTELDTSLTTNDLAIAFEVMENPTKATLFLKMQDDVRLVWLMRQIRAQDKA